MRKPLRAALVAVCLFIAFVVVQFPWSQRYCPNMPGEWAISEGCWVWKGSPLVAVLGDHR